MLKVNCKERCILCGKAFAYPGDRVINLNTNHMSNKDSQKLIDLAKKERGMNSSKEEAMARLVNAGIFNKNGNYTKNYPALASFSKQK